MRRPLRLGVRTRLLLAVVGVVSIALAIGVVAFNLFLGQRLSDSAISLARAQAAAERSSLEISDGTLVSPERPNEGVATGSPFWVFAGTRAVERPRVPAYWESAASSLAGGPERTIRVEESVRLYALPVMEGGRRVGTVVSGVALAPYDETATIAFVGSVLLAVILLAAVTILTHWILGKALLPVSRMTEDAAAWSEHDVDRRFDQGEPYDELTRLAATLDALLERLAASLRHEQRLTAELSHELRTPLARIAGESELALRRERTTEAYRASLGAISRNAEQMTRTVEALVSAARQEAGASRATCDARMGVQAAVQAVHEEAVAAGIEIRVSVPNDPVEVAIETDLIERIVHPLLENAVRYGRSLVVIGLAVSGSTAVVDIRDDGAGLRADEADVVFESGIRGSAAGDTRGSGLGLALARRLAGTAGGEIFARQDDGGGHFTVRLPLA
ncbi:MAG: HAMP domain-containing sensor histidine kinase [Thermoleophilia bacterium]